MKTLRYSLFMVLFLTGLAVPLLARAETVSLNVATCPDDYYGFILNVRNEHTRQQTLGDFFTRGYCQLNDLMELDQELEDVRENFRNAAYQCDNTQAYKDDYRRILMEQYFIRNIQRAKEGAIRTPDAEVFEELKTQRLENLHDEMLEIFVTDEDWVSETTFDEYYDSWTQKYDDRIGDYNACEEGAWAQLTDTWNDFVETINELSIDIDKGEKISFADNFSVDLDVEQNDFDESIKPILGAWDYLKSLKEQQEANIESATTVSDLNGENSTSFDQALEALSNDDLRYEIAQKTADRTARYKLLYGEGGAVAATDMQRILEEFNRILTTTNTKDFPNVISGASKVYDKQCN
jgi:hypothetical protein